jgi:hypothetical protein
MARGWESKSVEEQQSEAAKPALTSEDKERLTKEKAERQRKVQALNLMKARVKEQLERSQNARYNELLQNELGHIEKQLAKLS